MLIDIITLFPEMFAGVFGESIIKRAGRFESGGTADASRLTKNFSRSPRMEKKC